MILPMTAPGIIDQLWPPIATYATSNITCMQLCTAVVKGCYRFITESLGAAHISLGRLPVFFSPLCTSLTLLFSILYIVSFLWRSSPACTSLYFNSLFALLSPSLCFCLSAVSRDVWDTVNPGCWLQAVKTTQLIKVSSAGTLNHAGSKAWEPVSKPALSALHQTPITYQNKYNGSLSAGLYHACSIMCWVELGVQRRLKW